MMWKTTFLFQLFLLISITVSDDSIPDMGLGATGQTEVLTKMVKDFLHNMDKDLIKCQSRDEQVTRILIEIVDNSTEILKGIQTQITGIIQRLQDSKVKIRSDIEGCRAKPGSKMVGVNCFTYHIDKENWVKAREACVRQGADLAIPDDLSLFLQSINDQWPNLGTDSRIWMGLSDREDEGVYRIVTGGEISKNNTAWYGNEPNHNGDCIYAGYWDSSWAIADYDCDESYVYFCQY